MYYPLKMYICEKCLLLQVDEYKRSGEIFSDEYLYFASYSTAWLRHAREYVDMITSRLNLTRDSYVVEIASNDGYLLQNFKEKGIPCRGVEPASTIADIAITKGIDVIVDFFGVSLAQSLAEKYGRADLIIGNNVLAHVPDINDFVEGLKLTLKPRGTVTLEFPHVMKLFEQCQFDTIYHEHYSYLSLIFIKKLFAAHHLTVYDVEELPTHGGSLRVYGRHDEEESLCVADSVQAVLDKEISLGMHTIGYYLGFHERIRKIAQDLLGFLIRQKECNKKVAAYGAAAKGNTLLNYCGIKNLALIAYVVDASPYKIGMYLPGSHIPVAREEEIKASKPDFILILPWNIKEEIMEQLQYIREWGGRFVIPIPGLQVL